MATDFKEIENYIETNWRNYIPPSIDQDNLNHIEENIHLNRVTINEIIRRLGVVPSGSTPNKDQDIYDNSIYDTLINHKDAIAKLEADKLDKKIYYDAIGDINKLTGGKTLVEAINNRLRKDTTDTSNYSYSFLRLALTEDLQVGTTSTFNGAVLMNDTLSVSKKLTASGGINTTDLEATGDVSVGGKMTVKGATLLKDELTVQGRMYVQDIWCQNIHCQKNLDVIGDAMICGNTEIWGDTDIGKNLKTESINVIANNIGINDNRYSLYMSTEANKPAINNSPRCSINYNSWNKLVIIRLEE